MMHIFSAKSKTKHQKVAELNDSKTIVLPLKQHIGVPSIPVVVVGDKVSRFQLVADKNGYISSNIHSPISGTVKSIGEITMFDGQKSEAIVIENDFQNTICPQWEGEQQNWENLNSADLLSIIRLSGIVGEGGAQFPTYVKYDIKDKKVTTFIVNGTECEPYLTTDFSVMEQFTTELFTGIQIVNKILNADNIVICIEEQNKDLLQHFSPFLAKNEYKNIHVKILPNKYPQGGELQVIHSVLGKELPKGTLPLSEGIIVSNVGTIMAVYNAVVRNFPVVERVITVSGDKLQGAGNYLVKIGTPISHILDELKIDANLDNNQFVVGGPMMGKAIVDINAPIIKGSSAILNFTKKEKERDNCISCGYCVDVCPMHLVPLKFEELYRKGKIATLKKYSIDDCIECAACEYICPSNVPLIHSITNGKKELSKLK